MIKLMFYREQMIHPTHETQFDALFSPKCLKMPQISQQQLLRDQLLHDMSFTTAEVSEKL
jgi:hypothetical protein